MAKIPCEIIRDLLPLYQDDICSEKSRNAIEEHIKECESCRTYLKKMEGEIPIETDKIEGTDEEWKGFREFSEKVYVRKRSLCRNHHRPVNLLPYKPEADHLHDDRCNPGYRIRQEQESQ